MSTEKKTSNSAPKFTKIGFHTWKSKMNSYLRGRKQAHLALTTNRPNANVNQGQDRKEWDMRNDIALSHLAESVDQGENRAAERIVLAMTEEGRTATQIIEALKTKFFIEDNHVRIHCSTLFSTAEFLPGEKAISFLSRLEDMKSNLANLGKNLEDDTDMLGQLMAAMNKEPRFAVLLAAMKTQPDMNWDRAVEMLSTQIGGEEKVEHAKFTKAQDNVTCQICGKRNHTAKKCHFRYKDKEKDNSVRKESSTSKEKRDKSQITCFRCQQKGHYSNECPQKEKKGGADGMSGWDKPKESSRMMRETDSI